MKTIASVSLVSGLIGGVLFLLGGAYWAAPFGTGIMVGQKNWSLLFTVAGILSWGVSASLFVRGQTRKTIIATVRLVIPLVPVGILLALATGWVSTSSGVNPGGVSSNNYGLPFTWKVEQHSCLPPCVQANGSFYNSLFFTLDSLFFIFIGYLFLHEYQSRTKPISGSISSRQGVKQPTRSRGRNQTLVD